MMEIFPKINAPFKRYLDGKNKGRLIVGDWSRPEFEYLADNGWEFTEKVDGTNIRIQYYPGDDLSGPRAVFFRGRTDNAVIPTPLLEVLRETFTTDLFHRAGFVEDGVTLFGEGYGPKIQGGGKYRDDHSFILFDVKIGEWWLERDNVNDIADKLEIDSVPVLGTGTLHDAIEIVKDGLESKWSSKTAGFEAEGIVARPIVPLFNRRGERIITKIKAKDFK